MKYKVKIYCNEHSFGEENDETCFPFNAKFVFLIDDNYKQMLFTNVGDAMSAGAAYIVQNPDWHYEVLQENKTI